jgi:hypothetical protein
LDDLINAVVQRHRTAEQRALALFLYFICKWSLTAIARAFQVKCVSYVTNWLRRYNEGLGYSKKVRCQVFKLFSQAKRLWIIQQYNNNHTLY